MKLLTLVDFTIIRTVERGEVRNLASEGKRLLALSKMGNV